MLHVRRHAYGSKAEKVQLMVVPHLVCAERWSRTRGIRLEKAGHPLQSQWRACHLIAASAPASVSAGGLIFCSHRNITSAPRDRPEMRPGAARGNACAAPHRSLRLLHHCAATRPAQRDLRTPPQRRTTTATEKETNCTPLQPVRRSAHRRSRTVTPPLRATPPPRNPPTIAHTTYSPRDRAAAPRERRPHWGCTARSG